MHGALLPIFFIMLRLFYAYASNTFILLLSWGDFVLLLFLLGIMWDNPHNGKQLWNNEINDRVNWVTLFVIIYYYFWIILYYLCIISIVCIVVYLSRGRRNSPRVPLCQQGVGAGSQWTGLRVVWKTATRIARDPHMGSQCWCDVGDVCPWPHAN